MLETIENAKGNLSLRGAERQSNLEQKRDCRALRARNDM